ncbi:MinD/ParA family ATP-binding protein [Ilumatobacter sp.]|uniref:MinD/ParA family ATP-binding protein n=1 Tax=Ilumatobacter sp. TaxID=1967498 RepID=UPI003B52EA97
MSLIAVGSWRGVGTTTSALVLAAAAASRGERSWLVEADPAGGVLASRAPGLGGVNSLGRVAFESAGETAARSLDFSARPLGRVDVITGPWDSFQAWSAIATPRTPWVDALRRLDGTVIVDVGSLRGGSVPSWPIIERADALVMVTSPEPATLTSTVAWMDAKGQSAPGVAGLSLDTARLLVVDAPTASGERFDASVSTELGSRLVGWWPWEPKVIDHLHRGGSLDHKSIRRFALVRSADSTLGELLGNRPTGVVA